MILALIFARKARVYGFCELGGQKTVSSHAGAKEKRKGERRSRIDHVYLLLKALPCERNSLASEKQQAREVKSPTDELTH